MKRTYVALALAVPALLSAQSYADMVFHPGTYTEAQAGSFNFNTGPSTGSVVTGTTSAVSTNGRGETATALASTPKVTSNGVTTLTVTASAAQSVIPGNQPTGYATAFVGLVDSVTFRSDQVTQPTTFTLDITLSGTQTNFNPGPNQKPQQLISVTEYNSDFGGAGGFSLYSVGGGDIGFQGTQFKTLSKSWTILPNATGPLGGLEYHTIEFKIGANEYASNFSGGNTGVWFDGTITYKLTATAIPEPSFGAAFLLALPALSRRRR